MRNDMIENINVCAIVVTYNPNIIDLKENIDSVLDQVGMVCIVDNSTDTHIQKEILTFMKKEKIHIISNNGNYGIAFAQNIGMSWALENEYDAFLLLDQDSTLKRNSVTKLITGYHSLLDLNKKVACIGPVAFDRDKSEDQLYHSYGSGDKNIIEVQQTLSSGSLIPKESFINVGGMEEGLFIDIVDYEWCWRAKKKDYSTFVTNEVKMAHRLGEDRYHFFGMSIGIPSPVRHYYQFRNTIKMINRSYVPLNFKLKYILILPFKFLFFTIFIKPKYIRFKMMLKGIRDGFLGVDGKIKDRVII